MGTNCVHAHVHTCVCVYMHMKKIQKSRSYSKYGAKDLDSEINLPYMYMNNIFV